MIHEDDEDGGMWSRETDFELDNELPLLLDDLCPKPSLVKAPDGRSL